MGVTIWGIVVVAGAVILTGSAQAQVICPGEQPCPAGYHETIVDCKVCILDGYDIKNATDKVACPVGTYYVAEVDDCCPDGFHLKPDGMCFVVNDTDPCTCLPGWYQVKALTCCPDGSTLATDNANCCTKREDGKCCAAWQEHNPLIGACVPKKPVGVLVR